jgi:hypothetical protein
MTLLTLSAQAQTSKPEYVIKEDEPRTGSLIRRNAVHGSSIPINKRYDELTAEEKASVNQDYEKIEPGDEPPFPLDGLRPVYDAVRKIQGKLQVRGELYLIVTVGADGKATEVKVIGSPSPEMVRGAASVMLLTKFKPAQCRGQPCRMDFPFHFDFRLE